MAGRIGRPDTRSFGKAIQVAAAAGGFFAGYLWAVIRWAAGSGHAAGPLIQSAVAPGAAIAVFYALLVAVLFWPWIPIPRTTGVRAVVFPVIFSASLVTGALGIQAALRFLEWGGG